MDFLFLALIAGFFAACAALAVGCARLGTRR